MQTNYETTVIGFGNHASLEIPPENLAEIGGNKRAPLKVTINGHTYQSTATGVDGKCMVVFPTKDRQISGVAAGDNVKVTLVLDDGYREVDMPLELINALKAHGLTGVFHDLSYSKRRAFARSVSESRAVETRQRHIDKIISTIKSS